MAAKCGPRGILALTVLVALSLAVFMTREAIQPRFSVLSRRLGRALMSASADKYSRGEVARVASAWKKDADYDTAWSWPALVSGQAICNNGGGGEMANKTVIQAPRGMNIDVNSSVCRLNKTLPLGTYGAPGAGAGGVKAFVVLRWSRTWGGQPIPERPTPFHYCKRRRTVLYYTSDRALMPCADVVEFHDPDTQLRDLPPRGFPGQLFMVLTWESPIRGHSRTTDDGLMGQYNLLRSYRRDADLFLPFFPPCIGAWMRRPTAVPFAEREPRAVMFLTSNCDAENRRQDYVEDLMRHAEVHSYGRCLHNRDFPERVADPPAARDGDGAAVPPTAAAGRPRVTSTVQRYKFYIAMENSICQDYVTEKLSRGWKHGVIPVVTGYQDKPDYRHFAPNNHSHLNVNQFRNAAHLAERIGEIAASEALFASFLSYRSDPQEISAEFRELFFPKEDGDPEGWCRLVTRMQQVGGLRAMSERVLKGDHSCVQRGVVSS